MTDQTRVGARGDSGLDTGVDTDVDGDQDDSSVGSTTEDGNGSRASTAERAGASTVTVAPTAPSGTDPAASSPTAANGGPRAERAAAAERHPSFGQRLGLRGRGQLRARKVHRIVRRVDPWSILKLSLIFYFCVWVMVIVAGVLLWGVAVGSGTVASLESVIAEFMAFDEFRFNGDQLFQIFALGGLILVFVATAVTAILAVLFNLIADLTGGIRMTVVEEETARRVLRD